jgi:hypothetical protein
MGERKMATENRYDLYITDEDRNVILEELSIDSRAAERIIRRYPWHDGRQSYGQFWRPQTKYSLTIHFVESSKTFRVGFSDKASRLKLPLPYVGATYGLLSGIDQVSEALQLFFSGEFKALKQFLARYRPEQKGDAESSF